MEPRRPPEVPNRFPEHPQWSPRCTRALKVAPQTPNLSKRSRNIPTETQTDRKRDRQTGRQADRQTDRQRDKETERQRDRETKRQRDRKRQKEIENSGGVLANTTEI